MAVFNGGGDAWLDVGNKSVGVACLQAYFDFPPRNCLHVGDQVRLALYRALILKLNLPVVYSF
jgi:IMP-specific 5'-nucleotidase